MLRTTLFLAGQKFHPDKIFEKNIIVFSEKLDWEEYSQYRLRGGGGSMELHIANPK